MMGGCQSQEQRPLAEQESDDNYILVQNSDPNNKDAHAPNQRIAEHLAGIATDVPDVEGATAFIAGPYAVVGIDVEATLDRSEVGAIKYNVTEALLDDPYGRTAVVIADADATERIRGMSREAQAGAPAHGFMEELAGIVGRYMPVFPPNPEFQQTDDNIQNISPEDHRELTEIQEEQSNGNLKRD